MSRPIQVFADTITPDRGADDGGYLVSLEVGSKRFTRICVSETEMLHVAQEAAQILGVTVERRNI